MIKQKLIILLKSPHSVRMHITKKGILFFDGNVQGGPGYLLKDGKVIEVPINAITLSME